MELVIYYNSDLLYYYYITKVLSKLKNHLSILYLKDSINYN